MWLLAEGLNLHIPALVAKGDAVGACGAGLHVLGVHSRSGVRVLLRHADVAVALEEFDTLVAGLRLEAAHDEDVFVCHREVVFFEELLCSRDARLENFFCALHARMSFLERTHAELVCCNLHEFRIRFARSLALVAEEHLAVAFGHLEPGVAASVLVQGVHVGLLEVELGNRRHGGSEATAADAFTHVLDNLREQVEGLVFAHHEGVGGKCATRHGAEDNVGRNLTCFRREVIVLEAFDGDVVCFHELRNSVFIDDAIFAEGEDVVGALQSVEHGEEVRLSRTAGKRLATHVDTVGATFDSGLVLGHTGTAGVVAVDAEFGFFTEELAGALEGFVNLGRVGRTGSVLEADGLERNAGVENVAEDAFVEVRVMGALTTERKFHHGDDDFVFQTGFGDALAGVDEVVHVVQGVEVTDAGHAVLLEHVGMELDHVARLRSESHNVDAAGKRLEASLRAHDATEFVHHVECVFTAVLVKSLEASAATCFEVGDACMASSFDSRHEILHEHACAENRLESIAERGILEQNLFHSVSLWDKIPFLLYNKNTEVKIVKGLGFRVWCYSEWYMKKGWMGGKCFLGGL